MAVLFKITTPALLTGMVLGLLISVIQTLTQIQEQTLSFVPKALATCIVLLIFIPFMLEALARFMHQIMDRVVSGGAPP